MFKNSLFIIPLMIPCALQAADIDKQSYITKLEKNWLVLVKETDYSSEIAQEAIFVNNQTKQAMQKSGLSWQDINDVELTAIKNALKKNKPQTKAKL